MKKLFILLSVVIISNNVFAQKHDTVYSFWVTHKVDFYATSVRDLETADTLTVLPLCRCHCPWCDLLLESYNGLLFDIGYDYHNNVNKHNFKLGMGFYSNKSDLITMAEVSSTPDFEHWNFGVSCLRNIFYIPVLRGLVVIPLARTGLKTGFLKDSLAFTPYVEPVFALVYPNGKLHLSVSWIQPLMKTGLSAEKKGLYFGITVYFLGSRKN